MRGVAAISSESDAADAARAVLDAHHGAVDAVIAGFFAVAGRDPRVLFAPLSGIVAGAGVGVRAFDGRAVQPGRGGARPRGFLTENEAPPAAYVAASRTIAALTTLHAYRGRASLSELVKPGVIAAKAMGASKRAALLHRIGAHGVPALRSEAVTRPVIALAGTVSGGIMTLEDIYENFPGEAEATSSPLGEATSFTLPWSPEADVSTEAFAVLAGDARGLVAVLVAARPSSGLSVPELEVTLPVGAKPVMRGIQRTPSGRPIEAAAPIAAVRQGPSTMVVALPGRSRIDADALAPFAAQGLARAALGELCAQRSAAMALAVITDGRTSAELLATA